MSVDLKEFRVSNDILEDAGALRRRIDEEGYLFFRRLIDPRVVSNIKLQAFEVFREGGWLKSDSPLADGIADTSHTCVEGDAEYWPVYDNIQKLQSWHRLALSPPIMDLMEDLFAEPVMAHFWKVGRIMFPQNTTFMDARPPGLDVQSRNNRDVHLLDADGRLSARDGWSRPIAWDPQSWPV